MTGAECSGHPTAATTTLNEERARELSLQDRRVKVWQNREQLNIGIGYAYSMMHDNFQFHKMCASYVPKELTNEHKHRETGTNYLISPDSRPCHNRGSSCRSGCICCSLLCTTAVFMCVHAYMLCSIISIYLQQLSVEIYWKWMNFSVFYRPWCFLPSANCCVTQDFFFFCQSLNKHCCFLSFQTCFREANKENSVSMMKLILLLIFPQTFI